MQVLVLSGLIALRWPRVHRTRRPTIALLKKLGISPADLTTPRELPELHARAGDPKHAQAALAAAVEIYTSLGATLDAARAKATHLLPGHAAHWVCDNCN
jgi:hypothetical protein